MRRQRNHGGIRSWRGSSGPSAHRVAILLFHPLVAAAAGAAAERESHIKLAPAPSLCCAEGPTSSLLQCANVSAHEASRSRKSQRIALVTLVTPGFDEYASYSVSINAAYATSFGHDFQIRTGSSRLSSNVWRAGNVAAALDVLEDGARGADWVAWLDADAVVVDFSTDDALLAAIDRYATTSTHMLISQGELIGPGGSSLFNSGFILFRHNAWTRDFVTQWWAQLQLGEDNDQEVLERMYRADTLGAQSHVVIVPRGVFYSDIGDPIAKPPREQHVVHLAGVPNEVRRGVFRHFWQALCATAADPAESGAISVSDVSPESDALRHLYLKELARFVEDRSDEGGNGAGVCGRAIRDAGQDDRICLEAAERLSYGLRLAGRTAEATAWARGTLVVREAQLGPLDADTLASRERVAEAAEAEGRLDEAVANLRLVVDRRGLAYGSRGHRATLLAEMKLGRLLRRRGRLDEADAPTAEAQKLLVEGVGKDHPSALSATANLAELRLRQHRAAEAEAIYSSAAQTAAGRLGSGHETTLDLRQGAAEALLALGRADEARRVARGVVKRRRAAGASVGAAAGLARALETLAAAAEVRGPVGARKGEDPQTLQREAADLYETAFGPDSPKVVELRGAADMRRAQALAARAQAEGRAGEAEGWLREALVTAKPGSSSAAALANNLGMLIRRRGEGGAGSACSSDAGTLLTSAVADFGVSLGEGAVDTLRATGNLGDHLRECGRRAEALPLLRRALAGFKALRPGVAAPSDALIAESNLALLLYHDGRLSESESWYRHALSGNEAAFGRNSPEWRAADRDLQTLLRVIAQRGGTEAKAGSRPEGKAATSRAQGSHSRSRAARGDGGGRMAASRQDLVGDRASSAEPRAVGDGQAGRKDASSAKRFEIEARVTSSGAAKGKAEGPVGGEHAEEAGAHGTELRSAMWMPYQDANALAPKIVWLPSGTESNRASPRPKEGGIQPPAAANGPLSDIEFVDADLDVGLDQWPEATPSFNATLGGDKPQGDGPTAGRAADAEKRAEVKPRSNESTATRTPVLERLRHRGFYKVALPELAPRLKKAVKRLKKQKFGARIYEGVFSYSSPREWHSKIFVACPEDELVLAPLHVEDHGATSRVRLPDGDDGAFCELARQLKRLLTQDIFPELNLGERHCAVWETFVNQQLAGGMVTPHVHTDDFYGGVYYLEAPKGTVLAYGNGEPRPAEHANTMLHRWIQRAPGAVEPLPGEPQLIHPRTGDLVIFPVGWVKHWVPPITSEGTRTSIVFNTFCL